MKNKGGGTPPARHENQQLPEFIVYTLILKHRRKSHPDPGGIFVGHFKLENYPLAKLLHGERHQQAARLVRVQPSSFRRRYKAPSTTAPAVIVKATDDSVGTE